ncbi:MAG TPA: 3-oxoacid CoA-transferase subunit B [Rhodospirillales bacterium]|mgnify:FL=1|jgi:3-oxoacid CoA-transferase B subunit|nr:3-oxoacid CoA-transferase subunit B [Rhodospirillales bacterium]|tara:strand:+ start:340 stop:1029 length:690 start_codon:yes stop_codon:yes gene_type:complete
MTAVLEKIGLTRPQVAWRIAQEIDEGSYVNLGIGSPEMVANYVPTDREIVFHSENGILGMGEAPAPGQEDGNLINAGKKPVTLLPGGSYFSHTDSFVMIRGGHIDVCVLGAYQVAKNGDLANWATLDTSKPPGVGGAMDLAVGAKRIFVMMDHCTKTGKPKLMNKCTYPLTGSRVVRTVFTDLAVIDVTEDGFVVREITAGVSFEELQEKTDAVLTLSENWQTLAPPDV